jgi:hypothetical protein
VIRRILNWNGKEVYVFYSGCYGIVDGTNIIVLGLGPTKGHLIIGYGQTKSLQIGGPETAFAFPLGVPVAAASSLIAGVGKAVSKLVCWGSDICAHNKAFNGAYHHTFYEDADGSKMLDTLGFRKKVTTLRVVPKGVYLSSPSDHVMSIEEILTLNPERDIQRVPARHQFIQHSLIKGYSAMKARDPSVRLMGGIIVREDDTHMEIRTDVIREILKAVSA